MGNYSQLIFYGCCILLANNIANSEATFLGLFSQASHPPAATPRIAPLPAAPPAAGAAAGNSILLGKLTQISTKLSQLLSGLGNANGGIGGDAVTGTRISTSTAEEISPKIGDDEEETMMKVEKDGETDYAVDEHVEMDTEKEEEAPTEDEAEEEVKKPAKGVQTRTGIATNGKKQGNGFQLRKSIMTSSSGRAASLGTGSQGTVVRVSSQPQTRTDISPGVLAAISTSGGYTYQNQPAVQRTGVSYYQSQPTYQNVPAVQPTYYQAQPTYQAAPVPQPTYLTQPIAQRTYYQTQPTYQATAPRTGGYNYQNPGYQYKTVRYY